MNQIIKNQLVLRLAEVKDISAIELLIKISATELSENYYSDEQISSLNKYVFGVDKQLIIDGTYYVIECDEKIIACGGWSKREKIFGGDKVLLEEGLLNPAKDKVKIRAFFVSPNFARMGLVTQLMNKCEMDAYLFGFKEVELMSTLPGINFYQKLGYMDNEEVNYTLPDGIMVQFKRMSKSLVSKKVM
jgi:N-acetylglutamate synthase-like GNAT family acetyltransferase